MKELMNLKEARRMRLENTPDGRDVKQLYWRSRDEWNDKWMMDIELHWMLREFERDDRLLIPENTPDGRDVIKLE